MTDRKRRKEIWLISGSNFWNLIISGGKRLFPINLRSFVFESSGYPMINLDSSLLNSLNILIKNDACKEVIL
ncbi:MAG: hypothetical protein C0168_05150 [Candidatus Aminicenantes bacterium]|nr:MAG: hypothetical protein C0168_05150 [Candidatus Aminicenantes bacterium]